MQAVPEVAVAKGFAEKTEDRNPVSPHDGQPAATKASDAVATTEGSAADAVTTFREVRQPIERDDEEARQLLRLSQLEGRDPLQDAVAGRIALDRLDAVADGDADPQQAEWADQLRRELRERFNEIAPTKFTVQAES